MTARQTLRRYGFTLLEVALAVAVIVTLSAAAMISFRASNESLNEAGTNYTGGYLGELDNLLDDAGLGGDESSSSLEEGEGEEEPG
jgi:prepilin-type N-terminal cleavage/methylation domain-containing protein